MFKNEGRKFVDTDGLLTWNAPNVTQAFVSKLFQMKNSMSENRCSDITKLYADLPKPRIIIKLDEEAGVNVVAPSRSFDSAAPEAVSELLDN